MSRLHDNGASYMAEQAYDWFKKEVSALEQANKVVAQGFFANKSVNRQRAKAAKQVQYALKSAEKSFGPQGYNNAALVDWAQQWAQEQAAAKAETARRQQEYEDIYDLYDKLASESPKSAITNTEKTFLAEEPYLARHVRGYNVTIITDKVQLANGSLELVETDDGAVATTIAGRLLVDSTILVFEASRTSGFAGVLSAVDSNVFTTIDFATFNEQYAPQLQPASV